MAGKKAKEIKKFSEPGSNGKNNSVSVAPSDPAFMPSKTELGRELRALRAKRILSGERSLDWDEINSLVAERRHARDGE